MTTKGRRLLLGIVAILLGLSLAIGGGLWFLSGILDTPEGRQEVGRVLEKKLGRAVTLRGPAHLGLSWRQGLRLTVHDVTLGNPSWASHPFLAEVSRLDLGLRLPPLLHRQIEVTSFTLSGATINLEIGPAGQKSWELLPRSESPQSPAGAPTAAPSEKSLPFALLVRSGSLEEVRLVWRGRGEAPVTLTLREAHVAMTPASVALEGSGEALGQPITITVQGGSLDKALKVMGNRGQTTFSRL